MTLDQSKFQPKNDIIRSSQVAVSVQLGPTQQQRHKHTWTKPTTAPSLASSTSPCRKKPPEPTPPKRAKPLESSGIFTPSPRHVHTARRIDIHAIQVSIATRTDRTIDRIEIRTCSGDDRLG
jgi:hypothetical protein